MMIPMVLAVNLPAGLSETISNFTTAGQVIGGLLAGIFLLIAAVQFMTGGRQAVEMSKNRVVCVIVGMVLVAGCTVIKTFIDGLIAF
ncbi:hypothetical protein [Faecalispora anaeroviscerum]|uniref:hypothetical protein n=1 Tax=Faecalispora anaeroviscerum TaxID=2991836 RepID=UPI0024BACED6|nr:hypothetical protein [Faecalispora anaeroviscerum]